MTKAIIKVENLSKQYRLGDIGTGSIAHDLNRWWRSFRGKEDSYSKIVEENDRTVKGIGKYVWALRDINFEVDQGQAVGIIGRNGAGKSTLLKILSRTTSPTLGQIKIKGKIASLLEVGTGFHPDLTGRDNIFLNGAILGMRKEEIKKKFDEIVDFSGVEKYIDTPVKRYSSGMYVRLAFAVAAHLEPDILIVDEVLAVGDAEFQKKCLGKMKDVSGNDGRTILFVSHNMTAIKNLCSTSIFMNNGTLFKIGTTDEIINAYLSHNTNSGLIQVFEDCDNAPGNQFVKVKRFEVGIGDSRPGTLITIETPIVIELEFWNFVTDKTINLSLAIKTITQEHVFSVVTKAMNLDQGIHSGICHIPPNLLNDGIYTASIMVVAESSYPLFVFEDALTFEVMENREPTSWHGKWPGVVRPKLDFSLI